MSTFPTITPDVCRRYLSIGRATRNALAQQINLRAGRGSGQRDGIKGLAPHSLTHLPGSHPIYCGAAAERFHGSEGARIDRDTRPAHAALSTTEAATP